MNIASEMKVSEVRENLNGDHLLIGAATMDNQPVMDVQLTIPAAVREEFAGDLYSLSLVLNARWAKAQNGIRSGRNYSEPKIDPVTVNVNASLTNRSHEIDLFGGSQTFIGSVSSLRYIGN